MSRRHQQDDEILGKAYDARLVRRVLPWLRPHAVLIGVSIALVFVAAAANLAVPLLVRRLIDDHLVLGDPRGVSLLILLFILALTVEMVVRFAHLYLTELTGQNVVLALRTRVFSHLQRLDSSFFDANRVGRLMSRVTTDIEALADLFSSGVVTLLGDSLRLIAIVGILWWLDWRLALVTLTVVPILFLLSILFRTRIRHAYREVRRRIARINASLQEALSGMLIVQMFRSEPHQRETFTALNKDHRDSELQSVVYESSFSAIVELVANCAIALIVWYGGGRHLQNFLTFGTLFAFIRYSSLFFGPIRELSGFYAVMQGAMASLERIFQLLDTPPT
ncbi:MAG: ABC transporter ATP-binding protein, partial [Acidobacteriota bacterium]